MPMFMKNIVKILLIFLFVIMSNGCADALVKQTLIITSPFIAKAGKLFYDRNTDEDTTDTEVDETDNEEEYAD